MQTGHGNGTSARSGGREKDGRASAVAYGLVPTAIKVDTGLLETEFASRGWRRTVGPDWDLLWYTGQDPPREVLRELRPGQRMNHFPRVARHVSKAALGRTLAAAERAGVVPAVDFYPAAWRLPEEREAFERAARSQPGRAWIVKPLRGAGGRGIALYRDVDKVPTERHLLAQRYLDDPMTIDGCKFNLRVYLLITAIDPLAAWVHREGYVDLAGVPYARDGDAALDPRVFNTNTHVQSTATGRDPRACSLSLREWIDGRGDGCALWRSVKDVAARLARATAHALEGELAGYLANPNNCFELLGLDVQLGRDGRAWLIECNRSPELAALSSRRIKQALIRDLLDLVAAGEAEPGGTSRGFERLDADRH